MRPKPRQPIDSQEAAYLQLLLETSDAEVQKGALQRLCRLYRDGLRLQNPYPVVTTVLGLLHSEDSKVCRWALNTLALIGTARHVQPVLEAIQRNRNQPDILAAGVAALANLVDADTARKYLETSDLPLNGSILLAAAQQSGSFTKELGKTRVNIETAEPPELRLASILVGLQRAPRHLFSPKFENRKVIGQLNKHPDSVTAQYSVWAISENPKMSLRDLALALHEVEAQPENVRKHVYQLVTRDAKTAKRHYDFLIGASDDPSREARQGLSTGIRDIYFDSLEKLVFDWLTDEESDAVRQRLFEHMAANAIKFAGYASPVLTAYEFYPPNSIARARLATAARGTDLHLAMKRIEFQVNAQDLFGTAGSGMGGPTRGRAKSARTASRDWDALAQEAKFLLVTALAKEAAAVKAQFDDRRTIAVPGDPNVYELGVIIDGEGTERFVLHATSGMGKISASTLAANALRTFPAVEHILMVGIAGGCPNPMKVDEHVRLGDIVWSNSSGIIEYDFVKETSAGRVTRAHPQKVSVRLMGIATHLQSEEFLEEKPWNANITSALSRLDREFGRPSPSTDVLYDGELVIPHPADSLRDGKFPRVFSGGIATADTLQKNPAVRDQLREQYGVRAIEMEASGIQAAAWARDKSIFVVRGICDYCDTHKTDTWQKYAALAAAAYAKAMILALPSGWL